MLTPDMVELWSEDYVQNRYLAISSTKRFQHTQDISTNFKSVPEISGKTPMYLGTSVLGYLRTQVYNIGTRYIGTRYGRYLGTYAPSYLST